MNSIYDEQTFISALFYCGQHDSCENCPFREGDPDKHNTCGFNSMHLMTQKISDILDSRDSEIYALHMLLKRTKNETLIMERILDQARIILTPYIKDNMADELFNIIDNLLTAERRKLEYDT